MEPNEFLESYMAKNLGASGKGPELAAKVILPVIEKPGEMSTGNETIEMDIPGVRDDARIQPVGLFGDELPPGHPGLKYGFSHQGLGDPERGLVKYVPGGIPAPANYNMEASQRKYPSYFEGVTPGNVPAYYK